MSENVRPLFKSLFFFFVQVPYKIYIGRHRVCFSKESFTKKKKSQFITDVLSLRTFFKKPINISTHLLKMEVGKEEAKILCKVRINPHDAHF